jgi:hypothetical protein
VYFVLLAAAIAILVGVVAVAMGRGGEIVRTRRDVPVRPPRIRSATDVARLRLPIGLLGYQEQATDEALDAAARLIADQEDEIARLREEVWRLRSQHSEDTLADGQGGGAAGGGTDGGRAEGGAAVGDGPLGKQDKVASADPVGGQP